MKKFDQFLIGAVLLGAMSMANAQIVQNKGIRVVVPSPPGGFTDVISRVLVQGFNENYARGSYADNKPGAGTVVGVELVAKSAPDGNTILIVSFPFTVMNALYPATKTDVFRDFAAVSHMASVPSLLVVNATSPYGSVKDLVDAAKAQPGMILYASTSNGSSAHLFMELFKTLTKISLIHVPYKGNEGAMIDLIGGRVPVMFANLPNGLPHVMSGKLRALAITALSRFNSVPDVPTMAEAGVTDFEGDLWFGVVAPVATPKETVGRLNSEINRILVTGEVRKLLQSQNVRIVGGSPGACAEQIRRQVAVWSKVVRDANITAD